MEGLPFPAKVAVVAGATSIGVGIVATCIYKLRKPPAKFPPKPQSTDESVPKEASTTEATGPVKPPSGETERKEVKVEKEKEMTPLEKAEDWRLRGNKWFRAERYDKALQYYREALQVCPEGHPKERAIYYQNIAAAQERFGLNEKDETKKFEYQIQVIQSCTEAIKLHPQYPKPYARRGRAYSLLGQHSKALYDYIAISVLDDSIMKMVGGDFEKTIQDLAKQKVEEIEAGRTPNTPENISCTTVSAFVNVASQMRYLKRSGIEEIWKSWCEEHGEEEFGSVDEQPLMLAASAFEREQYLEVIHQCKEALASGAEFLKPYARLAHTTLLLLMHRTKEVLEGVTELLQMADVPPEVELYAYILRGEVHTENGEDKTALEAYTEAIEVDRDHPDGYIFRAKHHLADGETSNSSAAMDDMKKAHALKSNNPVILSNYAYALFKLGAATNSMMNVEEAVDMFKSAMQQFPKSAVVYATYGHMLQEAMQVQMAKENFEKAAELEPRNALHHVSLCFSVLFSGGDMNTATRHAENAIQRDPFCGLGYQALASLEMQRMNVDRAMELYEKACELTHSRLELSQCIAAYEMAKMQVKVCADLGVKLEDVMKTAENKLRQSMAAQM